MTGTFQHLVRSAARVAGVLAAFDAEHCDPDEGFGQVIAQFADRTREAVDIGFGRTNEE